MQFNMFIVTFLSLVVLGGAKSHIQAEIQNMKNKRRKSNTRNTKSKTQKQNSKDESHKRHQEEQGKGLLIGAIKVLVMILQNLMLS